MALIFPDIVRYSIIGGLQNELCVNVFDVELVDQAVVDLSREEEMDRLAGDLLNQWADHILPLVSWAYQAVEVRWVDLNNAAGTTGSRNATDGHTWPELGEREVATTPNNTYVKVKKNLEGKTRQQRSGLTRLGGVPENVTVVGNGNQLDATYIGDVNTGFENLKDGINGVTAGWNANLGVLHTVQGVATGFSQISTFSCQTTVGTIRRRMPGYGE